MPDAVPQVCKGRSPAPCAGLAAAVMFSIAGAAPAAAQSAGEPAVTRPARNDHLPDWAPKPKPRVAEERFRVEVTLLNAALDTQLRIDESLTEPGTDIAAEEDLGLDDSELLPLLEVTLLPGERHLVRLSGMSTRRNAQKLINQRIVFDDEVYEVNERVDSTLNLTMFGLAYGYRFVVHDRGELAATFGIQIAEIEANAVVRSRVVREAENAVAPVPLAGLEGRFDFSDRWGAEARVQYLSVEVDEVEGSMLDWRAALTWRKNPHLVFGLGYRSFEIEVDSRDEGTPGYFDFSIAGPQLFMRASL